MGTYVQEKQSSPGTKPTLYPRALVQPVGHTQAVSDPRKTAWPHAASAQQCDTWRRRGLSRALAGGHRVESPEPLIVATMGARTALLQRKEALRLGAEVRSLPSFWLWHRRSAGSTASRARL